MPSPITTTGNPKLVTTETQRDYKPSTKSVQTQYKPSTKSVRNPVQSQYKPRPATNTPVTPSLETQYKVSTQPSTQPSTNPVQTQYKLSTNLPFSSIVGLQRRIILFVFDASKTSREKLTAPIALRNLADACQTTAMAAQGSTRRLEQKNLLHRREYKNGRGGWTRYELPNDLFQELLQLETQYKVSTNPVQTQYKVSTQPSTQPSTSVPSSSSSIDSKNFKTTTTGEPELFESTAIQFAPDWLSLDVSPLAEIGFTQAHLTQIVHQGKLTPVELQDSIHFFAFDLKRNEKGKSLNGPPLNFFMGIVRKGIPYAPPENFESPADEVRRKTREFKERKECERQAEEQKILDLEFSEWRRGLTGENLIQLLPEYARKSGPMQDSTLKSHFKAEVWPSRQAALQLGVFENEHQQIRTAITQSLIQSEKRTES